MLKVKELMGVPTGFPEWDEFTGGIRPGELTILASITSIGKSALCMNVAVRNATDSSREILWLDFVSDDEMFVNRALSFLGRVPHQGVRHGRLEENEILRVREASRRLRETDIEFIHDRFYARVEQLVVRIRNFIADHPNVLVIIDSLRSLQNANFPGDRDGGMWENLAILRQTAERTKAPILVMADAQMSADEPPPPTTIDDLLGSAEGIRNFAHNIWLMHRREFTRDRDITDLYVAKSEQGRYGSVELEFDKPLMRFTELRATSP